MARFLSFWRTNPVAPWPIDPVEYLKLLEKMWAGVDSLLKKAEIKEVGYFPDGTSGYVISEGDSADVLRRISMFSRYIQFEVHEIIPYEKSKEIIRAVWKAQAEAAKK